MVDTDCRTSERRREAGCRYAAFREGVLVPVRAGDPAPSALAEFVHGQFRALVLEPRFPCVGARSAVRRGAYRFALYAELDTAGTTAAMLSDLQTFVIERGSADLTTFVTCFVGPLPRNDPHFRALVRSQLQRLRHADPAPWDPTVSADPDDPHYAYSVAGRAFTIVPLWALSPRWARRFAWPTVILNAEAVFHRLRDDGVLDRFRDTVRARDVALQGDLNPEAHPG